MFSGFLNLKALWLDATGGGALLTKKQGAQKCGDAVEAGTGSVRSESAPELPGRQGCPC